MNIKVSQNPSQRNLHVEGGAPCERVPVFRWNSQADLALVSATKVHETTPQPRNIHDFHGAHVNPVNPHAQHPCMQFQLVGNRFGQLESRIFVGFSRGY